MEGFEKNLINDYTTQQVSIHTLATKYHIGAIKVRKILNNANVERRKRGGQRKDKKTLYMITINQNIFHVKVINSYADQKTEAISKRQII